MRDIFKQKKDSAKDIQKPAAKTKAAQSQKLPKESPGIQKTPPAPEQSSKPSVQKPIGLTDIMQSKPETIPIQSAELIKRCKDIYQRCIDW